MIISIITVTLNDLPNLKKTAESLIIQSCKAFQWVIKDGFSNDGTEDYVKSIQVSNELNISYYREKDNSVYDAMNQAVRYITGDYVLFLNAGDIFHSKHIIDLTMESMKNSPSYSFFYGDNYDLAPENILIYKKARSISYLKNSLPTSHQAIFYKTSLFEKYKYPLNYKICADYALTAQMYYDGNKTFHYLDFPICIFSLGGLSQINRKQLLKEGFLVHRNIVKDSLFLSGFKYVKRFFTFFILDKHPRLYTKVRKFFDMYRKS